MVLIGQMKKISEKLYDYDVVVDNNTFKYYIKKRVSLVNLDEGDHYRLFYTESRYWYFNLWLPPKRRSCIVRLCTPYYANKDYVFFAPTSQFPIESYGKTWGVVRLK